jgi:rod shape-determining protein MreD
VTPERSPLRRAVTGLVLTVALFAAVIVQLTVVNRLPLPGSAGPDLVLLVVTAIAVVTGPAAGAVAGFAGGLALDVAPPATHMAGEYALVFCLAGYAAAWAVAAVAQLSAERDTLTSFAIMVVAAAAGEAGVAGIGLLLADPDVTPAAVTRVLPSAILYDLVLAPVVFWLAYRLTRVRAETAPALEFSYAQRLASAFRPASSGAAPHLGLAGTGADYNRPPPAGRVPRLRLSAAGPLTGPRRGITDSGGRAFPVAGARALKISFAGDLTGRAGAGKRTARTPGKNWLRTGSGSAALGAPGPGTSALRSPRPPVRRAPAHGWLSAAPGRRAGGPSGLSGPRSAADALAARSAPSGLSALAGGGTPLGRRGPSAGWLRAGRRASGPSSRGRTKLSPRRGWLGAGRRRTVIGSTVSTSNVIGSRGIGHGSALRRSAKRRRGAARGHAGGGYGSGRWLRHGRGYRPGGRPSAPRRSLSGARYPLSSGRGFRHRIGRAARMLGLVSR